MNPNQWRKIDKEVDFLNKQYEKDGSTFRAYKTDDPHQPFIVVDLADNSLPNRDALIVKYGIDLNLYKLTKPF